MEHLSLNSTPCSSAFPQLCAVFFLQPSSVPLTTVRMEPRGNTFCPYPRTAAAAAAGKSPQSCLTLCDPIDGSPLGSSVPGILQARILEWVAIS